MTDAARFDRPELAPLWAELRHRFEQGPVTTIRLRNLTTAQQHALADLLGQARLPGSDPVIPRRRLDEALRPVGLDSRRVVEAISGPLIDRPTQRAAARQRRDELWEWLAAHPVVAAQPALTAWVASVRATGLIGGSVERTWDRLGRVLTVLAALPADGQSRPAFAGKVCGDEHALDDGTPLAGMVLRAIAAQRGEPAPEGAEQRRRLWESVGVACDALSTAVLVAGLHLAGDDPLATTLRRWAETGHAAWVTLAHLRAAPNPQPVVKLARVVENPSVVTEALARLGPACPPLICVLGWPNTAAIRLLRRLAEAGCALAYHGDLDGEGVRIAAYVMAKTAAVPWRMSTADYLCHVPVEGPSVGRVTDAPWDPTLAAAMRDRGVAVSEERVLPVLLDDLSHVDAAWPG